ncbi:MAG: hydrogenase expression protein [Candidatus Latescibacteria bacterium]|nr:hydrogenase expression protein [Candidatus Latescibacterota bacterium]
MKYPPGKLPHGELARLLRSYTDVHPRLVVSPGLGLDAAVIEMGDRYLVAKTDPITFATDEIGWYAVHVNANDIAAMGGTPRFFLSTVLVPADHATPELVESIFRSIHEAARSLGVAVCGGHTEITPGITHPIVVGQMLGEVSPQGLVRPSGLQVGDAILLTKGLAIEATALIAREKGEELRRRGYGEELLDRCRHFLRDPGLSVVRDAHLALRAGRVHALHDPTEGGVATGLMELAAAVGVGLEIFADELYLAPESARLCAEFGLDPLGVISSGALLIGCAAGDAAGIAAALEREGIKAAQIGTVRPEEFGLQLRRSGGLEPLPRFAVDEITRIF